MEKHLKPSEIYEQYICSTLSTQTQKKIKKIQEIWGIAFRLM